MCTNPHWKYEEIFYRGSFLKEAMNNSTEPLKCTTSQRPKARCGFYRRKSKLFKSKLKHTYNFAKRRIPYGTFWNIWIIGLSKFSKTQPKWWSWKFDKRFIDILVVEFSKDIALTRFFFSIKANQKENSLRLFTLKLCIVLQFWTIAKAYASM